MHLRATRNTGADPAEVAEVLLHVAAYAGIPAANSAFALLKAEFDPPASGRADGESAEVLERSDHGHHDDR